MPQVFTYQSVFHIISSFLEQLFKCEKKHFELEMLLCNALKLKNNHRIHMAFFRAI